MRALLLKDFLVAKRYVAVMLAVGAALPLLMLRSFPPGEAPPDAVGAMAFTVAAVYIAVMSLMQLAQKESADRQAVALLATTPLRRSVMVLSTYVFVFALVGALTAIYAVEGALAPALLSMPPLLPAAAFCLLALTVGTVTPLLYLLGYDRTKTVFPILLVAAPFLFPWLLANTPLLGWLNQDSALIAAILWVVGGAYLALSVLVSTRVFSRSDIA